MSKSKETDVFIPSSSATDNSLRRCQPCLIVAVVTSILLNVVVTTVFLILVVFRPTQTASSTMVNDRLKDSVCFDCSYVGSEVKSSDTLYNLYRSSNQTICCLRDDNGLNKVFKQIISDEQNIEGSGLSWTPGSTCTNHHSASGNTSDIITSIRRNNTGAHLYLDLRALKDGDLSWTDNYNTAYISGVKYQARALYIPTSGQYLVYSHITYTRKYPGTQGGKNFIHTISRYHPRQPNLGNINILISKNSYPTLTAHKSSFLLSVLHLRAGDQLSVTVSDVNLVHDQSMSSYFGVKKL